MKIPAILSGRAGVFFDCRFQTQKSPRSFRCGLAVLSQSRSGGFRGYGESHWVVKLFIISMKTMRCKVAFASGHDSHLFSKCCALIAVLARNNYLISCGWIFGALRGTSLVSRLAVAPLKALPANKIAAPS